MRPLEFGYYWSEDAHVQDHALVADVFLIRSAVDVSDFLVVLEKNGRFAMGLAPCPPLCVSNTAVHACVNACAHFH